MSWRFWATGHAVPAGAYLAAGQEEAYDLGDNESHRVCGGRLTQPIRYQVDCICYENPAMGICFIEDPDGCWIEIIPATDRGSGATASRLPGKHEQCGRADRGGTVRMASLFQRLCRENQRNAPL